MKKVFIFLFDGFSDWEIAYLTPEINKNDDFELIYFSKKGSDVLSMGGMQISPNTSLEKIIPEDVDLLILPGGNAWESGGNKEIEKLVRTVIAAGNVVAAICAATTYLGQLGVLDDIKHTSNDLNYLQTIAPNYLGKINYQNKLAVTDGNIITSNGIAAIEFAREILEKVEIYDLVQSEKWFQLFKNGIWQD